MLSFVAFVAVTQDAVDPNAVQDAIQVITTNWSTYGWLGGIAGFLSVAVMVFRMVAPNLWGKLQKWHKLLIVFVLAGAAAGILAGLGGGGVASAVTAGIMAGFAAIGMNQGGKALKEVKKKPVVAKDPTSG